MTSFTMTPAQAKERIAPFDVSTYQGWLDAAKALLADKPEWVALVHHSNLGYMLMVNDYLSCLPYEAQDHVHRYEDLSEPDNSAWDDHRKCWDGETAEACLHMLLNPVFQSIKHQRYAEVPLELLPGLTGDQLVYLDVMPFNHGELVEGDAVSHYYTAADHVILVAESA